MKLAFGIRSSWVKVLSWFQSRATLARMASHNTQRLSLVMEALAEAEQQVKSVERTAALSAKRHAAALKDVQEELAAARAEQSATRHEVIDWESQCDKLKSRVELLEAEVEFLTVWREKELARLDREAAMHAAKKVGFDVSSFDREE